MPAPGSRPVSAAGLVLVALAALACGAINSLAGGGSLILFPALIASGLPRLDANVTNSVITWPGYLGGVVGFRHDIVPQRSRLLPLLLVTVAGSATGCVLLLITPSAAFDVIVPALVLFASLLIAFQPRLKQRLGAAPTDDHRRVARLVAIFFASIYGGYFGAALGVILTAVLMFTFNDTLHRLTALRSVLSLADASVSLLIFGLFGPVQWVAVAVAAPCTLVGGFLGARLAGRIDEQTLRIGVVVFGITAAVLLAAF